MQKVLPITLFASILTVTLPTIAGAEVIADTRYKMAGVYGHGTWSATVPTLDTCLRLGKTRAIVANEDGQTVTICSDRDTGLPIAKQVCRDKVCTTERLDGQ